MEALKAAVKETLRKKSGYHWGFASVVRDQPKPFADLPGRQRKKARKAARRAAKKVAAQ